MEPIEPVDLARRTRFELLYDRHAVDVKAYVLRRASASVADDLLAEIFLVCWRRLDDVPAEPLPWLLGVARRTLSSHRRGERRGLALRDRIAREPTPASSTLAGHGDDGTPPSLENDALRGALARLSEPDRELLLLVAWEGLSPTEAAAALEIRPATVRVRLHRARRRLTLALSLEHANPKTRTPVSMEASP